MYASPCDPVPNLLSSGTVYKALPRLCREKNIRRLEEIGPRNQRYYELTSKGRRRLSREISVLRNIIRIFDLPYHHMD
jgi:DNA-binding PadR family transcriptional regulator